MKSSMEFKGIHWTQDTEYWIRITQILNPWWAFNPFHDTGFFLNPLKTSENQRLSDVSQSINKEKWHEMD